ncbi:MAG: hypothetical protein IJD99_04075 [Clostridia bacterium]|nr:hypothetical protein [Clostridia bacterium]
MLDILFEQRLSEWPRFSSTLWEQSNAKCARNPAKRIQVMLKELLSLHPFLQQLFLCRQWRIPDSPLHEEVKVLAEMRYHTTPEQLLEEFEAALKYFWALMTLQHAEELIAEDPLSAVASIQRMHRAQAIADMDRFGDTPSSLRHELVRQYKRDAGYLTAHSYDDLTAEADWRKTIQQQLIDSFWAPCGADAQYRAGYALALAGQSDKYLPMPFSCLGYSGPSWDEGGITFAIDRRCFSSPDPLLYYKDDSPWSPESWGLALRLSSGLADVRRESSFFTFRLSPASHHRIFINREDILLIEPDRSLFVRCGSRDFQAECGEIVNGKRIPLARFSI